MTSPWADLVAGLTKDPPVPAGDCGRVECELGWEWHPRLQDHDAWLVVRGRGRALFDGQDIELGAGSLWLLRPGDTGDFTQDPNDRLTVLYCHFTASVLPDRYRRLRHLAPVADLMQRLIRVERDPHPLGKLDGTALLLQLFAEVYRQDGQVASVDMRLQEVLDFVRANPGRRPTLDEAARLAGLAPAGLSRLFSRQLGISFRRYVLESRLERARQLLSESAMSVGQVSRALGYGDVFLFSRQFSAHFGEPPSALRLSVQQVDDSDHVPSVTGKPRFEEGRAKE